MNPAIFCAQYCCIELSFKAIFYFSDKYQKNRLTSLDQEEQQQLLDIKNKNVQDEQLDPLLIQQKKLQDLKQELIEMQNEAETLNTPSTFVQHSKLQRRILKKSQEYKQNQQELESITQNYQSQTQESQQKENIEQKNIIQNYVLVKKSTQKNIDNLAKISYISKYILRFILFMIYYNQSFSFLFNSSLIYPFNYFFGEQENKTFVLRNIWIMMSFLFIDVIESLIVKMIRKKK